MRKIIKKIFGGHPTPHISFDLMIKSIAILKRNIMNNTKVSLGSALVSSLVIMM